MTFLPAAAALRWVARFPVTIGYVLALSVVAFVQRGLAAPRNEQLIADASTNLGNLADGRVETLLASAFVTQEDPNRIWVWLPGFACLLALGELLWRSRRLAGAVALGHVGGTMVVAAGLVVALRLGWVASSVADEADVGVSYATMGVIGALVGVLPRALRPAWAAWWLSVAAVAAWFDRDFTSVGHLVSAGLGVAAGAWLARGDGASWTLLPLVLAPGACAFGFGVLVDGFGLADGFNPQAAAAVLIGASCAALAAGVAASAREGG